jgi:hypothetical protein
MASTARRFICALFAIAFIAAQAPGATTVNAGFDLFQTQASGTMFNGVNFMGVPLGTYNFGGSIGTQNTGNTDTIVQRLASSSVSTTPSTASPINLQITALQLESTTPVNYNGNGLNNYFLTLQSARAGGGTASTGQMDITFNNASGGTFSSFFDIFFDIRQGSLSGPIVDSNSVLLSNSSVPWGRTAPSNAVLINGANNLLNGTDNSTDIWPSGTTDEADGTANDNLSNSTPEPSSAALLLAGMGLLARRSRQGL